MMAETAAAIFGAGCFWGVEAAFRAVEGVIDVTSGYAGGETENPTYEAVCRGTTGHAEVVRVIYDPLLVTYEQLLNCFFRIHDPTQLNRQGPDVGTQYRSVIITLDEAQKMTAEAMMADLEKTLEQPVVTVIQQEAPFYPAEEYHQRYIEKKGGGHCHWPFS